MWGVMDPKPLRIMLLGGFRVMVGDDIIPAEAWRRRKVRSLVKLLALAHGHRLHREQLMDQLWPNLAPTAAANNFYQALHLARRTLDPTSTVGAHYLHLQDEVIQLCPTEPLWIDVEAFEAATERARQGQDPAAYRAALDLYTGDLLPEDRYEEWISTRQETLRQECQVLLVELAGLYVARAAHPAAIQTLRQVLTSDPAHEEAHRSLMRLYTLTGQRTQALRQYQSLQEALHRELGAEPEAESRQLYQQILAGSFPPTEPPQKPQPATGAMSGSTADTLAGTEQIGETRGGAILAQRSGHRLPVGTDFLSLNRQDTPHNLSIQVTSFIGREREKVEIRSLLVTTRLLTLTGPGGCGKTRLALEVATDLLAEYHDGVWLIALAPLAEPALVPQAVAAALGVWEVPGRQIIETLTSYLQRKRAVVVLDNCEHLIDSCAQLCDVLLRTCPHLRLLATSREPLHIAGEVTWPVPSLALPDLRQLPPLDALVGYAAMQLFIDRARAVLSTFTVTEQNAAVVAQVCYRLDGLPLAIELAAAQVRALAVPQIADRLADRFGLLVGGSRTTLSRQQTLKATLDWSYDLLSEHERVVYRRLTVFAGGFSLEAAEAVGAGDGMDKSEILNLLTHLVDKSLVLMEEQLGAARYRLLETIRQYGLERLTESGEATLVRRRHARFFLALAEAAEPELHGVRQAAWLERLEREHDNLRNALAWSLEAADAGDAEVGLRLAGALAWFWRVRGHLTEGRRWLEGVLSRAVEHSPTRARTLASAGALTVFQGDYLVARSWLEASVAIARELREKQSLAYALVWRSLAEVFQGNFAAVRALDGESRAIFHELGDRWGLALALMLSGIPAAETGDYALAHARFAKSLALFRELGDTWGIADATVNLANVAYRQGDYALARARLDEVLAIEQERPDKWVLVRALSLMGEVARTQGDYATAAAACAESIAVARELGLKATIEAWSLRSLGYVSCVQGDTHRAAAHFAESLALFRTSKARLGIACCLMGFAVVASADARPERAVRLFGAAAALLDTIKATLAPADRSEYERTVAALRGQLGTQEFAVAWEEGQALTLEQAIAYAIGATMT
jgi:predicted ATPase/DNA-binding SARP family transcriptional activator